jgi:hypothetical protein
MRPAAAALTSSPKFAWAYALYIPFIAYLIYVGPLITWDSDSFIHPGSQRPPVYSVFLWLLRSIAGSSYLEIVHVPQILLGAAAAFFFCRTARNVFELSHLVTFVVSGVFAICYLRYPPVGNYVLSEALALPLFIVFAAFVIRAVAYRRLGDYLAVFAVANLLVLTRHQFLFLYPFCLFLLAYQLWTVRKIRQSLLLLCALVATSLAAHGLERAYHYLLTGKASAFPLSGLQLSGIAFYLAKPEDAAVLEPREAELLGRVLPEIRRRNMSARQYADLSPHYVDPSLHLEASYSAIVVYILFPAATEVVLGRSIPGESWQELPSVMSLDEAKRLDAFLLGMWRKLVVANLADYVALYVRNVIVHAGGWIVLAVLAASFAVAGLSALATGGALAASVAFAILLHAGNLLFVALVEPLYQRYAVYSESVVFAVLLLAICRAATAPPPVRPTA